VNGRMYATTIAVSSRRSVRASRSPSSCFAANTAWSMSWQARMTALALLSSWLRSDSCIGELNVVRDLSAVIESFRRPTKRAISAHDRPWR